MTFVFAGCPALLYGPYVPEGAYGYIDGEDPDRRIDQGESNDPDESTLCNKK
jgi:hypothetical protein